MLIHLQQTLPKDTRSFTVDLCCKCDQLNTYTFMLYVHIHTPGHTGYILWADVYVTFTVSWLFVQDRNYQTLTRCFSLLRLREMSLPLTDVSSWLRRSWIVLRSVWPLP